MTKRKGDAKMVQRSLKVPLSLWESAQLKADAVPLAEIIRTFLEGWLYGLIDFHEIRQKLREKKEKGG